MLAMNASSRMRRGTYGRALRARFHCLSQSIGARVAVRLAANKSPASEPAQRIIRSNGQVGAPLASRRHGAEWQVSVMIRAALRTGTDRHRYIHAYTLKLNPQDSNTETASQPASQPARQTDRQTDRQT
eukprot:3937405-Rhodomonas_salina.2